jgi:hypothetical protein
MRASQSFLLARAEGLSPALLRGVWPSSWGCSFDNYGVVKLSDLIYWAKHFRVMWKKQPGKTLASLFLVRLDRLLQFSNWGNLPRCPEGRPKGWAVPHIIWSDGVETALSLAFSEVRLLGR